MTTAMSTADGPTRHPFESFLQLEEVEYRTTKVGRTKLAASQRPGVR